MNFIISTLKGIAIGAGAILPGISSGVLCVIFGIYEKIVDSILGIFKDFKKNFLFLSPIFLGIFIGVFAFGNVLKYLFANFESQTKTLFIGLILGCIPCLFKQANSKSGFRLHFLIYSIASFFIGLLLFKIENSTNISFSNNTNFYLFILSGFLMSIGVVVPGVSSTVILMCLGTYYTYLEAISILNLSVLIPMGIGLFLGCIIFLKLINLLLKKYYSQTFYSIIGFVFGSIFILIPNSNFSFINIFIFLIGLIIGLMSH